MTDIIETEYKEILDNLQSMSEFENVRKIIHVFSEKIVL